VRWRNRVGISRRRACGSAPLISGIEGRGSPSAHLLRSRSSQIGKWPRPELRRVTICSRLWREAANAIASSSVWSYL
jgi:hypothetical protein